MILFVHWLSLYCIIQVGELAIVDLSPNKTYQATSGMSPKRDNLTIVGASFERNYSSSNYTDNQNLSRAFDTNACCDDDWRNYRWLDKLNFGQTEDGETSLAPETAEEVTTEEATTEEVTTEEKVSVVLPPHWRRTCFKNKEWCLKFLENLKELGFLHVVAPQFTDEDVTLEPKVVSTSIPGDKKVPSITSVFFVDTRNRGEMV